MSDQIAAPLDPLEALKFLANCVTSNPNMLGDDGVPIHWMVKDTGRGFLVCDSAFLMTGVNYSGIHFNVRGPLREISAEDMAPMFKVVLDYLESIVPESKDWAVEFKGDTPLVPTDRKVINA